MSQRASDGWSAKDSSELYSVARWSKGYFSVSDRGHILVHPDRDPTRTIDMKELVDRLQMQDVKLPIRLRFGGILRDRLREIDDAFATPIAEYGYQNEYTCVYPIKVNEQAHVVTEIVGHGSEFGFGLEAGSKPEMLAVIAMTDSDRPIICNGFKDAEYVEMALLAQKIGRKVIPVVEKYTELQLVLDLAEKVGVRPEIGVRVKLAAKGAGRWEGSAGFKSKFGLTASEVLQALQHLTERGMQDCFKLLHFHLGSQVTHVRQIKRALIEASRIYVDLAQRGAGLEYLDVGGGLGVDYTGSQTSSDSSMNYTVQEYANDVVYHLQTICDEANVPHPHIISESGRAITAYHSVLVFGVLGVSGLGTRDQPANVSDDAPQPLKDLELTRLELTPANLHESFHDAQASMELMSNLFSAGHATLLDRSSAENLFWSICRRINEYVHDMREVPDELKQLERMLSATYFCNFSLFQSIPDSWAIKQLFPVMPIHRLDEQPTQHAVIGDITCDSDGKIDRFIAHGDTHRTMLLHEYDGSPYLLAAFLTGAYQEILGDMHNLFGGTNAVHVSLDATGEVALDHIVKGDTVRQVLDQVDFDSQTLVRGLQSAIETALRTNDIDHQEAERILLFFEETLGGYTYLEE